MIYFLLATIYLRLLMNSIETNMKTNCNESLNKIEFKLNLRLTQNTGDIEEAMLEFFDEIKAEVYEKAKASQKKYFKLSDSCIMVDPDYLKSYHELDEVMSYFNCLRKNEKWYRDNKELYHKIEEYYQENNPSHLWSVSDCTDAFHGNPSVKSFDESYDSFTNTVFKDLKQYCHYYGFILRFLKIEFYFTNFCNCDDVYKGCMCD